MMCNGIKKSCTKLDKHPYGGFRLEKELVNLSHCVPCSLFETFNIFSRLVNDLFFIVFILIFVLSTLYSFFFLYDSKRVVLYLFSTSL